MHRAASSCLLASIVSLVLSPFLGAQTPLANSPESDSPALIVWEIVPGELFGPSISIQQDLGDGVGWRNGFTRLDGLIPLLQTRGQSLLFANLRGVVFDDVHLWQFDGGAGYRWYNDSLNHIFGVNSFYDYRYTGSSSFHQLGLGGELLGECWDIRSNVYVPVGLQHHRIAQSPAGSSVQFQGFNVVLGETQVFEAAMRGLDLEVGRSLPLLEQFDPRAYLGVYHFDTEGGKVANGIRARFTARLTERLQVLAQVQNDGLFQTTASGGLLLTLGGRSGHSRGRRPLPERLDEPVIREASVVVETQQRSSVEPAIDPATGQPFIVKHAEASAAARGDGSFEHPYQTLSQLEAGSAPGQILFVRDGQYAGGITLQPGQRLLGDGIVHLIVARQGTLALPILQPGATPTVLGVSMAANTEVSGFFTGVSAAGITGSIDVNRNHLTSITTLSDITGPVSVTGNVSATPDSEGTVYLSRITGPVTFSHNTIDTTFNTFVTDIAGPLTYTNNTIRYFGPRDTLSSSGVTTTWTVSNNVITGSGLNIPPLPGNPALVIMGNGGLLSVNLIGNTTNFGIGLGNLQYFASGNTGPIVDIGGSKRVSAPLP